MTCENKLCHARSRQHKGLGECAKDLEGELEKREMEVHCSGLIQYLHHNECVNEGKMKDNDLEAYFKMCKHYAKECKLLVDIVQKKSDETKILNAEIVKKTNFLGQLNNAKGRLNHKTK